MTDDRLKALLFRWRRGEDANTVEAGQAIEELALIRGITLDPPQSQSLTTDLLRIADLERQLAAARQRIKELEEINNGLVRSKISLEVRVRELETRTADQERYLSGAIASNDSLQLERDALKAWKLQIQNMVGK